MATVTTETPSTTAHRAEDAPAPEAVPRLYMISVAHYERMVESGVFDENGALYLWKGQLVERMTKGPDHNSAFSDLTAALVRLVPDGWHVRPECPLLVGTHSLPEPDFSVARGKPRDYLKRNVAAKDVSLVVEVSDSSVSFDSGDKLQTFAEALVPVYWVVNLPARTIDVYTTPSGPSETTPPCYASCQRFGPDDEVPVVLDGREVGRVAVRDILP